MPGPLAPDGVPARRTRADRFDDLALDVIEEIVELWPDLASLDVAVEDVPVLATGWRGEHVPLASLVPIADTAGRRTSVRGRLVFFRRPIEHRAGSREDLSALLLTVACDQLASLLGVRPEEVHPAYPD